MFLGGSGVWFDGDSGLKLEDFGPKSFSVEEFRDLESLDKF
jgi:hypothetical protein